MCGPALPFAMLASSLISTGVGIIQGNKAVSAQRAATAQAEKQAAETKAANERAINAANQKQPDIAAIIGANRASQGGGVGSTMLTGPGGVPTGTLSLGKNTLLGR